MQMKRIVVVAGFLVLAMSFAASLAAACCSSEHHVTKQRMDACPTASCCVTLARLTLRTDDTAWTHVLATAPLAADASTITTPHTRPARWRRADRQSPGATQTTPVLLL